MCCAHFECDQHAKIDPRRHSAQVDDAAASEEAAEKQLLDQQSDPAEESQAAADGRSIYIGSVRHAVRRHVSEPSRSTTRPRKRS